MTVNKKENASSPIYLLTQDKLIEKIEAEN
jgi:hypothetical protein